MPLMSRLPNYTCTRRQEESVTPALTPALPRGCEGRSVLVSRADETPLRRRHREGEKRPFPRVETERRDAARTAVRLRLSGTGRHGGQVVVLLGVARGGER
ncbi:hypothetical protein E2C01_064697 [Portunus trituberculatus]|uniref:Uncharacterized protein n=1 Tax=Portunus trituberculatus TaxID=210409 RepID=A0A5B7HP29_PORTR|nr:hypothetical protein [Portunus trituberculatus]